MRVSTAAAVGFFAHLVQADIQSYCASGASSVCYSISYPNATTSSGSGDIFLQLSAPETYQWIGLGYGSQMRGAYMFIMYADGNGNVTVSPRTGTGHVEPQYNSDANLTLLEGSGVSNGTLTANLKCTGTACGTTIDTSSTSSNWIAAWRTGTALDSTDLEESISQHDDHAQFTYDLTTATDSNDVNPFISSAATSPSSDGSSTSTSGSSTVSSSSTSTVDNITIAHGVIMGVTVALLLPLGAIAIRCFNMWIHLGIQVLSIILLWTGFGLGVKLADDTQQAFNNTHTIFGTVIICLFMIQPFLGVIHHRRYIATQSRTISSHLHIWLGRILILLAIINGGLGLQLADNTTGGVVAYSVVAGVMVVAWAIIVPLTDWRKKKAEAGEKRRLGSQ